LDAHHVHARREAHDGPRDRAHDVRRRHAGLRQRRARQRHLSLGHVVR
jgi:hypothetical protein